MIENGRKPFRNSCMTGSRARAKANLKWQPILQPIVSKDQVWIYEKTGTFKNNSLGDKANNKKNEFTPEEIIRIENQKIVEHWDAMDLYTMFEQMNA
jgi:hypothetical protein